MGKNQAYKAMQRSRVGSSSAATNETDDGMADGSFHSPEWHAARLASLQTSHTITWEEFKRKQKEDELKKGEVEADKDRMMREYRAQLDAERAQKLAQGRNRSKLSSHSKKERKDKDKEKDKDKDMKKRSKKKRKHRRSSELSSSDSSSSEYSSSDSEDEGRDSRRSRSKSRSKRSKKEKRHRSRSKTKHSGSDSEEGGGPVPLSKFFGCAKD